MFYKHPNDPNSYSVKSFFFISKNVIYTNDYSMHEEHRANPENILLNLNLETSFDFFFFFLVENPRP